VLGQTAQLLQRMAGSTTALLLLLFLAPAVPSMRVVELQPDLVPEPLEKWTSMRVYTMSARELMQDRAQEAERGLTDEARKPVGLKSSVAGVGEDVVVHYDKHDKGLFSQIFQAYSNHWDLVTRPEDWWFEIIRKVALAIDNNSKKESVRKFFVSHEGKKELRVILGQSVESANYSSFLEQMTDQVAENIRQPEYVDIMRANFSTTTDIHRIVSNIAVMNSVQEYFDFYGSILCGIPRVEMIGEEEDWQALADKFDSLQGYLAPISVDIGLEGWWQGASAVLENLASSYSGKWDQDVNMTEWWSKIVTQTGSGGCGIPERFSGWFVTDFLATEMTEIPSGLVSVPLTVTDGYTTEDTALVAGIPGFWVTEDFSLNRTKIEAVQTWTLMMDQYSPFRQDVVKWIDNEIQDEGLWNSKDLIFEY